MLVVLRMGPEESEDTVMSLCCGCCTMVVVFMGEVTTTDEEVAVAALGKGLRAIIFFPPGPVITMSCLPEACREAANAGGTMICRTIGCFFDCCNCCCEASSLICGSRRPGAEEICTTEAEPVSRSPK